jgi:hypothetical protein
VAVAPVGCLGDRTGSAPVIVEIAKPGIGIGLKDPGIPGEMAARVLAAAVPGVVEHRGWRVWTGERPIIPDISPQSANHGFILSPDRHSGADARQLTRAGGASR